MSKLIPSVCLVCLFSAAIIAQSTQSQTKLSELSQLKAENLKLRAQLISCSNSINDAALQKTKLELEAEFKRELNAKDSEQFDWNSLTFGTTVQPK